MTLERGCDKIKMYKYAMRINQCILLMTSNSFLNKGLGGVVSG